MWKKCLFAGAGVLVLFFLLRWVFAPDPLDVFLAEVDEMLALANEGRHGRLVDYASPEALERAAQDYMPLPSLLIMIHRVDRAEGRQYRRGNVAVFYPRDYAEIEIIRSNRGGNFDRSQSFPVPFVCQKRKWKVAGDFRGEDRWIRP